MAFCFEKSSSEHCAWCLRPSLHSGKGKLERPVLEPKTFQDLLFTLNHLDGFGMLRWFKFKSQRLFKAINLDQTGGAASTPKGCGRLSRGRTVWSINTLLNWLNPTCPRESQRKPKKARLWKKEPDMWGPACKTRRHDSAFLQFWLPHDCLNQITLLKGSTPREVSRKQDDSAASARGTICSCIFCERKDKIWQDMILAFKNVSIILKVSWQDSRRLLAALQEVSPQHLLQYHATRL